MITKINAYKSSDGSAHATLEKAQTHELMAMFLPQIGEETDREVVVSVIMANTDKIVDILTMKPNSLPKARKINGGTKKRTPKHIAEQAPLPFAAPQTETPAVSA